MGAKRTMPTVVVLDGDNTQLANFLGPLDENLRQIAIAWGVEVGRNGNRINIEGAQAQAAANAIHLFHRQARHKDLSIDDIQLGLVELKASPAPSNPASSSPATQRSTNRSKEPLVQEEVLPELPPLDDESDSIALRTRRNDLRPRTPRQRAYLNNILRHDITFGVGPAGTGKTWLAVACAIDALERDNVQRIILTRPAVEAGERLGFLPGDLAQKVDP